VADLIPLRLRSRKLEALWEPDARWELLPLPSQVSARYVSFTPLGEDRFALITLRSAEVLEVDSAAAWRSLPLPRSPRSHHAAVRLPSGELMITGGLAPEGTALRSTEILGLDGVWRDGPELTEARLRHSAVVTTGGTVLVFGGEREGRALVTTERLRGDAWRRYDDGERATTRGNLWPGDGFAVLTASDYFVWADHGRVWRLAEGALQMRTDETATLLDAEGEPSRDIAVPGMFRSAIQLRDGSIAAVVERTLYRGREPFDAWEQLAELPPRLRGNLSLTELQDGSLLVFATEPFLQAARLRLSE
ncbi:MAG: kelch repeat-containing protein, partial [Myxococcota bacterium]